MIAELVKEDKNYTYRIKSKRNVVIESRYYTTKRAALKGFIRFNSSVKVGRIVVCNDVGCHHVEIMDASNRVIAESVNLNSAVRVRTLKRGLRRKPLILKDLETNKMRTYIQNIGDIQLKEPLTVVVEKSDDYVASIDRLRNFAYGEDLKEVMSELNQELVDLYNDLFNGKYKLAKPAIELKSYLQNIMK